LSVIEAGHSTHDLLEAIVAFQRQFMAGPEPRPAFERALDLCLDRTQSDFGFIGELGCTNDSEPVLALCALAGEAWKDSFRSNGERSAATNIELDDFEQAIGARISTGKAIHFNANSRGGKHARAPKNLPLFTTFLGLPIVSGSGELLGLVGLANRPDGYDATLASRLQPVCEALGAMLDASRREQRRRDAEELLRESEARLRIFADHVTDGLFLQDAATRVVDVNRRACESLGYRREELIGMTPLDFDSAITQVDIQANVARLAEGETITIDSRHRRKDGSDFPVEIRVRPLWIDGKLHTLALVCDISERKQAELKLQESQERLQLALAASRMGVWEWDISNDTVYWSPECYDIFRVASFDGRAESFRKHVHPDDLSNLVKDVERAIREHTYSTWEFRIRTADGQERWIANCATVSRDSTGSAQKVIGTARDVTDEKLAAEEIREQNAILHTILESTTDFIYMKDCQGRYVTVNASAAAFIGKPVQEIIGRTDVELFPPEVAAEIQSHERQLFAEETELRYEEAIPSGGRTMHLSTAKNVCRDSTGHLIGLVGITRDITAHVEAEEALRQSTILLENVVENIPLAVFVKDPKDEFRIRLWNKAAESIFGFKREEMMGHSAYDYWPPEQANAYHAIDEQVMREGRAVEVAEEPSCTRDGRTMIVHTRKMPLFDRHGKPTLLLAICEDITARKRADEALREAQRRLEFTLKGADVGLWDWDLVTDEVNFSEEWKSQLGYHGDEVANNNTEWESRVHPDDLARARENVQDAIEHRTQEYRSEFRMRHKNGSWRWILSRGAVIDDPRGKPTRMLGVHIDITDRKRTEEALQVSESRYRSFVDHATDALFLQDHTGRVVDVNQQACASLGYSREELIGMLPKDFDPDATSEFSARLLRRLEGGETVAFDSQHKRKDGSTFPVEVRLRPFWINDQRFHIGLVRDITERKRSEQSLRESEARLRTLLENLDKVAVQAYEPDGTITFWNRASEFFYGYSASQALGRDLVELLHAEPTRESERKIMAEALRTGKPPGAEEVEVVRRDGSKITVFASRVVHPRAGRPSEFFCFDVDISDRKRAEEELALRQAELLHASRLSTVGQMVAEISHEVAQPLNAIGNFAAASERILETNGQVQLSTLHEYVRAILDQNQRCITILGRLRDFSRRAPATHTNCDIGQLLHDSVDLMSLELRRNSVKVEFKLSEELPMLQGDRIQLQQVIVNLLTNARDAVDGQPEDRRTIAIRTYSEHEMIVFEVEDAGCGLSGDAIQHLFDPFFTTKRHGMGIGLSICQTIVKDHGGRIEAVSNSLGGATFRVRLPLGGKKGHD
jgi:PAS domain S-box-containing protein